LYLVENFEFGVGRAAGKIWCWKGCGKNLVLEGLREKFAVQRGN
jgi:hypothetical protein